MSWKLWNKYRFTERSTSFCSKRRRNTEASARFRAKKKEREHALDIRASTWPWLSILILPPDVHSEELEAQVAQLSADKASLQNENKLLKTIVLGGGLSRGQESLKDTIQAIGAKRKRD